MTQQINGQLAECYMILGGIPYYWHFLDKGLSVAQNVDELFFAGHDKLENWFDELYESLFRSPEPTELANSGNLSECLKDLERCGFVRKYVPLGRRARGCVYQLMDNYTLFYFKFVEPNHGVDKSHWTKMLGTSAHNTWAGLAFERLCLQHVDQIREALRIGGVHANIHAWRSPLAQIDLLIDRDDGIVNLCEMKFAADEFEVTATDDRDMKRRMADVTTCGLKKNSYAKNVQSEVTLDDLFRP